jgi:hypothetical protein
MEPRRRMIDLLILAPTFPSGPSGGSAWDHFGPIMRFG